MLIFPTTVVPYFPLSTNPHTKEGLLTRLTERDERTVGWNRLTPKQSHNTRARGWKFEEGNDTEHTKIAPETTRDD